MRGRVRGRVRAHAVEEGGGRIDHAVEQGTVQAPRQLHRQVGVGARHGVLLPEHGHPREAAQLRLEALAHVVLKHPLAQIARL